ncbi:hypothetical protein [Pengzhenrongella phosphoraccumulans]|uniref:hypothetical protein n=1 Tax=Pengzhenrongella phosphoraccumulans TaxID=3114394 RepID=UPI00388FC4D1
MDTSRVAMLLLGAGSLALTGITRSRRSAGKWGGTEGQERFVIVGLPCLGVVLMLGGLLAGLPAAVRGPGAVVAVLLCFVSIGWGVFYLPLPRWAVPGHLRARRTRRLATGEP